jgi:hypothetical protein
VQIKTSFAQFIGSFMVDFDATKLAGKLPQAIVVHELLGIGFMAAAWMACYRRSPTLFALSRPWARRSFARCGAKWPSIQQRFERAKERASGSAWFNKVREATSTLPPRLSPDPQRFVFSYAESVVLRRLASPFTIPFKLYLTYAIVSNGNDCDD